MTRVRVGVSMRSSRPMREYEGRSRALVAQKRPRPIVVRNSDLAVAPPRRLPLTTKARRSFAKLTWHTILASIFAIMGYVYHDPDMRKALDYQLTLLCLLYTSPSPRDGL